MLRRTAYLQLMLELGQACERVTHLSYMLRGREVWRFGRLGQVLRYFLSPDSFNYLKKDF